MRAFKPLALAALTAVAMVLALPGVALANGGDLHFGSTQVPLIVFIGFGGFVGLMVAFFMANWARYRRAMTRNGPSSGPEGSQTREEEGDNDIG